MPSLQEGALVSFLVALVVIIVLARIGGEIARRVRQPEVLGQLAAGVLLGPSVLGLVAHSADHWLLDRHDAGFALSGVSWIGALLVLFAAGLEVDLRVLRARLRLGLLAAFFAIVPSFLAGAAFGSVVLGLPTTSAAFLGIVLSVSAVSVASALLIEWQQTRREFAQVILAGGVAAEVGVWIWVAVDGASRHGSPGLAAARTFAIAIAFFVGTVVIGRRFVRRAMRVASDHALVVGGPLSLVLVTMFGFAAVTQALGLHALLGAFVAGVLLARAPRTNPVLVDRLGALTLSVFGPVFFVLAGAQVDLTQIASGTALSQVAELFAVAIVVKVGFTAVGAWLGGFRDSRALLVGAGLNAKGGTDVVVAIVGHELGLLPARAYTIYTVVAIVTVLVTPTLMRALERRSPPAPAEAHRLEREEATARAYSSTVERVLLPVVPALWPTLALDVVETLARAEEVRSRTLDITQLRPAERSDEPSQQELERSVAGSDVLRHGKGVATLPVEADDHDTIADGIAAAATRHDLVAIGAAPHGEPHLFGPLGDDVVHRVEADSLVVVARDRPRLAWSSIDRILVPTNGLPHAEAAADIGGLLAQQTGAAVTLLHVAPSGRRDAVSAAHLTDLCTLLRRLDIAVSPQVRRAADAGRELLAEIDRGGHDLVVVGAVDRGRDSRPFLGHTVERLVASSPVPVVVLVVRPSREAAAA